MVGIKRLTSGRSVSDYVFLLLLGFSAGFLNGLLGTGGGILVVFALRFYLGGKSDLSPRDVFACALSVMLPLSLLSVGRYAGAGVLDLSAFSPMLFPAVGGGLLGGFLLDRLKLRWLRVLFALLVLWSGAVMLIRG